MFVFLGKEHKSTFLIERDGGGVCINRDETTGTSTHCGKNMLYLQENRSTYLFTCVIFGYGKAADFDCRIFLAPL